MLPFAPVLCLNLYSGDFVFIIKISNFGVHQEQLFTSPVPAANRRLTLTETVHALALPREHLGRFGWKSG